eukprot:403356732
MGQSFNMQIQQVSNNLSQSQNFSKTTALPTSYANSVLQSQQIERLKIGRYVKQQLATQKDDTNISDGEDDSISRGRVNSMRTNIRDLAGSITENKFRELSINNNTKENSIKNSSFGMKNLSSSQNRSLKDDSVSISLDSNADQFIDPKEYKALPIVTNYSNRNSGEVQQQLQVNSFFQRNKVKSSDEFDEVLLKGIGSMHEQDNSYILEEVKSQTELITLPIPRQDSSVMSKMKIMRKTKKIKHCHQTNQYQYSLCKQISLLNYRPNIPHHFKIQLIFKQILIKIGSLMHQFRVDLSMRNIKIKAQSNLHQKITYKKLVHKINQKLSNSQADLIRTLSMDLRYYPQHEVYNDGDQEISDNENQISHKFKEQYQTGSTQIQTPSTMSGMQIKKKKSNFFISQNQSQDRSQKRRTFIHQERPNMSRQQHERHFSPEPSAKQQEDILNAIYQNPSHISQSHKRPREPEDVHDFDQKYQGCKLKLVDIQEQNLKLNYLLMALNRNKVNLKQKHDKIIQKNRQMQTQINFLLNIT